jgi:hypothetical protein
MNKHKFEKVPFNTPLKGIWTHRYNSTTTGVLYCVICTLCEKSISIATYDEDVICGSCNNYRIWEGYAYSDG